ncbi:unnamed protein product [Fraxinus pennsylvanica]|uniref:Chromo domain-containing protein n=1 Tax=Fraxinus pennsylvanica TaxID=56036 RepID=A0AAD1Z7S9_9LAMI|nr:unnamed protein product [Fraxinus pennsylvanica]
MVVGVVKYPEESKRFEATEAAFEGEGKEEDYQQLENSNEELEQALPKGKVQYLIKWRGRSEAENTREPLDNLLQCSDVIDAFEESLKAGKSQSTLKRKRRSGLTFTHTKKNHQQQTPVAATYNVPSHSSQIMTLLKNSNLAFVEQKTHSWKSHINFNSLA